MSPTEPRDLSQQRANPSADHDDRGQSPPPRVPDSGAGAWLRDRSLGLFFLTLFLVSWVGQLFVEWRVFADEQRDHGADPRFWSADFWETFWQSTLENWQSEFLQIATFAIAAAYLVYKGSSESPDSSERMEAKLDALLVKQGVDPRTVEGGLPGKYRKTR